MIISGKRVLITGGAKRCGAELVKVFAAAGAITAVHCNTSRAEAENLCRSLPGRGHRVYQADLSKVANAEKLAAEVGEFDILINNASVFFRPGSAEDIAAAELYENIHYVSPVILLNALFDNSPPEGCAVNILDQAVFGPGTSPYLNSRKKLLEYSMTLVQKWGEKNMRINNLAPGPMLPPAWAPESKMAKTIPVLPLKRPVSLPDVAAAVMLLCANDSITGALLPVDCGQHLV